jgi:hypothetical protein
MAGYLLDKEYAEIIVYFIAQDGWLLMEYAENEVVRHRPHTQLKMQ